MTLTASIEDDIRRRRNSLRIAKALLREAIRTGQNIEAARRSVHRHQARLTAALADLGYAKALDAARDPGLVARARKLGAV